MSKMQKLRSTIALITYLPELITGFFSGLLTAIYLVGKNLIPMIPAIFRVIARFCLTTFKALVVTFGIFALASFAVGGTVNLPVLIATALVNGNFYTLPVLMQHAFALLFAASMANFKNSNNLEPEDRAKGYEPFVVGLIRFWLPGLSLMLEIGKAILQGLEVLDQDPKQPKNDLSFMQRFELQLNSASKQIFANVDISIEYVRDFKQNASEYLSSLEILQTISNKMSTGYDLLILTPGRWLGLVAEQEVAGDIPLPNPGPETPLTSMTDDQDVHEDQDNIVNNHIRGAATSVFLSRSAALRRLDEGEPFKVSTDVPSKDEDIKKIAKNAVIGNENPAPVLQMQYEI